MDGRALTDIDTREDLRIVSNGIVFRIEQLVTRRRWFRRVAVWQGMSYAQVPPAARPKFNCRAVDLGRSAEWHRVADARQALATIRELRAAERRGFHPIEVSR